MNISGLTLGDRVEFINVAIEGTRGTVVGFCDGPLWEKYLRTYHAADAEWTGYAAIKTDNGDYSIPH